MIGRAFSGTGGLLSRIGFGKQGRKGFQGFEGGLRIAEQEGVPAPMETPETQDLQAMDAAGRAVSADSMSSGAEGGLGIPNYEKNDYQQGIVNRFQWPSPSQPVDMPGQGAKAPGYENQPGPRQSPLENAQEIVGAENELMDNVREIAAREQQDQRDERDTGMIANILRSLTGLFGGRNGGGQSAQAPQRR